MNDTQGVIILVLLGGFYFILEGLRLLLWFLFSRKTFMSWWTNSPVDKDSSHMYCPIYSYRGFSMHWRINPKWLSVNYGKGGDELKNHRGLC